MEVTSEQMNSLKALADTNLQVSKAQEVLFALQKTETEYLVSREKKALERISNIIIGSADALREANQNYYETTQFYNTTASFAQQLTNQYELFKSVVDDFDEKNKQWELHIASEENRLSEMIQQIKSDKIRIENDKKAVERANKNIEKEKQIIESRQAQIKSALEVLKEKQHG